MPNKKTNLPKGYGTYPAEPSIMDPVSVKPDPNSAFQVNPDPDPDAGF
jgi:hypothetical protein